MGFVVGIDGPAGSGKGTVTKAIANKTNLINIDTGITYRCVALEVLRHKKQQANSTVSFYSIFYLLPIKP